MTVFSEDGRRFVRVEPGESIGDSVGFAGAKRDETTSGVFYYAGRRKRWQEPFSTLNNSAKLAR